MRRRGTSSFSVTSAKSTRLHWQKQSFNRDGVWLDKKGSWCQTEGSDPFSLVLRGSDRFFFYKYILFSLSNLTLCCFKEDLLTSPKLWRCFTTAWTSLWFFKLNTKHYGMFFIKSLCAFNLTIKPGVLTETKSDYPTLSGAPKHNINHQPWASKFCWAGNKTLFGLESFWPTVQEHFFQTEALSCCSTHETTLVVGFWCFFT